LAATSPESPIAKFIDKKGEEFITSFAVEDIVSEIARLQKEGFVVLNEIPKKVRITNRFLHPKAQMEF
jgi:methylmalonyl-CoA/ethylmalonyl-CoA epimerase